MSDALPGSGARGAIGGHAARDVLVVSFLVALVSFSFDFLTERFLASDVIRHMAARLFLPYDAFIYGLGSGPADRERIVVVDIGKPTLDRYRSSWPLAYGQHARILERVRRARPRALFIDFQFQSARDDPSLPALMRSLCAYASDGIPVFLASDPEAGPDALRPEFEALRGEGGQPCFRPVAVGYEADNADRNVWSYPLTVPARGGRRSSAALAMAEATLGRRLEAAGGDSVMGLVWGSGDEESLGPGWIVTNRAGHAGADDGAVAASGREPPLAEAPESAHERLGLHYCRSGSAWDLLPFVAAFRDSRPNCPMHRALEAGTLTGPRTVAGNDALDAALRDRAVFYGSSFDANEFVNSPLHGELPGIYLHAQATDNLLRFGNRWRRPEIFGAMGSHWEHPMAFGGFWFAALILVVVHRLLHRLRHRLRSPVRPAAHRSREPLRAPVRILHELRRHAMSMAGRLGVFYAMLVVAVPLSLTFEWAFCVSVIGYSSVLGFCLLGEALTESTEWSEALWGGAASEPRK